MDYFLLKQDEWYTDTPLLYDVMKKVDIRDINREDEHRISDTVIFYVKAKVDSSYTDVLDSQLYLVTENLKNIIEKYDTDIAFKFIPLIDSENKRQENYFLPVFEEVEALSPNSVFNLNKTVIKKIILDDKKIKGKKVFKIKESVKPLIVVRLDAAESILRRNFKGIKLERLVVE